MAFPTKDVLLVAYSTNWDTRLTATPTVFACTSAQATAYHAVHEPYLAAVAALTEAAAAGTRSKSLTATRDSTKKALLDYGRQLYATIQASSAVTDANKDLLGVTVKPTSVTPIGIPSATPSIDVVERVGTSVRVRIHTGSGARRSRPAGCQGISVFSFVGPAAPSDPSEFTFQGNTTRSDFTVQFDFGLAPGTVVWLTAAYYNPRGQTGPGCTPVSAILAGGGMPLAA